MTQDFRTYLDRVVLTPPEKRGANITISHPKTPAIRWHEAHKGCRDIDEAPFFLDESRIAQNTNSLGNDSNSLTVKAL